MNMLIKITFIATSLFLTACASQVEDRNQYSSENCTKQSAVIIGGTGYCV